jgi:hypothetical protein
MMNRKAELLAGTVADSGHKSTGPWAPHQDLHHTILS